MQNFEAWILSQLKDSTPSLQVSVLKGGGKVYENQFGENFQYYDLASLTKVLFTVQAVIYAVETNKIIISDPVKKYWPEFANPQVCIQDLLTHSSGLLWWKAFFEELKKVDSIAERKVRLQDDIIELSKQLQNFRSKSVYSDVGFFALGFVLESAYGKSWKEIFSLLQSQALIPENLHFNPIGEGLKYSKELYAPTEILDWRGEVIQGYVHDENSWCLGGITPHAGLFGNLNSVTDFLLLQRQILLGNSKIISAQTLQGFLTRQVDESVGDWALGYMMPTRGGSSAGKHFSHSSVGHTGFTGTSLWWDLQKDVMVVLLSNRTYLGKDKKDFTKLRPMIHDRIMEELGLVGN